MPNTALLYQIESGNQSLRDHFICERTGVDGIVEQQPVIDSSAAFAPQH
ncbi:hypothetical protein [Cohnella sp. GCM10012308]